MFWNKKRVTPEVVKQAVDVKVASYRDAFQCRATLMEKMMNEPYVRGDAFPSSVETSMTVDVTSRKALVDKYYDLYSQINQKIHSDTVLPRYAIVQNPETLLYEVSQRQGVNHGILTPSIIYQMSRYTNRTAYDDYGLPSQIKLPERNLEDDIRELDYAIEYMKEQLARDIQSYAKSIHWGKILIPYETKARAKTALAKYVKIQEDKANLDAPTYFRGPPLEEIEFDVNEAQII